VTPRRESGFDEGDVGGQTPGDDVGPTLEMVATSTQVPGAPPCASEVRIVSHKSKTEVSGPGVMETHVMGFVEKSNPQERMPPQVLQDRIGHDLPRRAEGHVDLPIHHWTWSVGMGSRMAMGSCLWTWDRGTVFWSTL
jgi:hypothetical protein